MSNAPTTPRLLLSVREAAAALAICEKSLWSMTVPRGTIPTIRIGRSVRYAVDDLQKWIDDQRKAVPSETT